MPKMTHFWPQKVHGFRVETRICHIVPISRMYNPQDGNCFNKSLELRGHLKPVTMNGGAPKERRRRRAEKRSSKRVFSENPFLLCSLKIEVFRCLKGRTLNGQRRNGLSGNTLLARTTPSPLLWRTLITLRIFWGCFLEITSRGKK